MFGWALRQAELMTLRDSERRAQVDLAVALQKLVDLERMNARLESDLDWAKFRINLVEKERYALMQVHLGTRVGLPAPPEFVPTARPDEALNEDSNPFKDTGEDSLEPQDRFPQGARQGADGVDYSRLPGYKAPKE